MKLLMECFPIFLRIKFELQKTKQQENLIFYCLELLLLISPYFPNIAGNVCYKAKYNCRTHEYESNKNFWMLT